MSLTRDFIKIIPSVQLWRRIKDRHQLEMSSYTFSRLSKSNESQTHCFRNFHPWITLCSWLSFVNYFLFVYRRYFKITIYGGVTEINIGIRRKRLSLKFQSLDICLKHPRWKWLKKEEKKKNTWDAQPFKGERVRHT